MRISVSLSPEGIQKAIDELELLSQISLPAVCSQFCFLIADEVKYQLRDGGDNPAHELTGRLRQNIWDAEPEIMVDGSVRLVVNPVDNGFHYAATEALNTKGSDDHDFVAGVARDTREVAQQVWDHEIKGLL